jgi:hypothetical protein
MDGTAAISSNLEALKSVLAGMVAMAGLGDAAFTSPLRGGRRSPDRRVGVIEAPQPPPDASRRPPLKGEVAAHPAPPSLSRHPAPPAAGRSRRAAADHRGSAWSGCASAAAAQIQAEADDGRAAAAPLRHRRRDVISRSCRGGRRGAPSRRHPCRWPPHPEPAAVRSAQASVPESPPHRPRTRRAAHHVPRRHRAVLPPAAALARRPDRCHASWPAPRCTGRRARRSAGAGKTLCPLEGAPRLSAATARPRPRQAHLAAQKRTSAGRPSLALRSVRQKPPQHPRCRRGPGARPCAGPLRAQPRHVMTPAECEQGGSMARCESRRGDDETRG